MFNFYTVFLFIISFGILLIIIFKFFTRENKKDELKKIDREIKKIEKENGYVNYDLKLEAKIRSGMLDASQVYERFNKIISDAKNGSFKLNAIEMVFFSKYFGEQIIKSDTGNYYLIEKSAIYKFVRGVREAGIKELLKEYNEIYKEIAPKMIDGKIVIDASQLFYKIRNESYNFENDNREIEIHSLQKTIDEIKASSNEMKITDKVEVKIEDAKEETKENKNTKKRKRFTEDGSMIMYHEIEGDYTLVHRDGTETEVVANKNDSTKYNPMSEAIIELKSLVELMQSNMMNSTNMHNEQTSKLIESVIGSLANNQYSSKQEVEKVTEKLKEIDLDDEDITVINQEQEVVDALIDSGEIKGVSDLGVLEVAEPIVADDIKNEIDDFFSMGDLIENKKEIKKDDKKIVEDEIVNLVNNLDELNKFIKDLAKFKVDEIGGFYKYKYNFYFSIGSFLALLLKKLSTQNINADFFYETNGNLKYAFIVRMIKKFNEECANTYHINFTNAKKYLVINYILEEQYTDKVYAINNDFINFLSPTLSLDFEKQLNHEIKKLKFSFTKKGIDNEKRLLVNESSIFSK